MLVKVLDHTLCLSIDIASEQKVAALERAQDNPMNTTIARRNKVEEFAARIITSLNTVHNLSPVAQLDMTADFGDVAVFVPFNRNTTRDNTSTRSHYVQASGPFRLSNMH